LFAHIVGKQPMGKYPVGKQLKLQKSIHIPYPLSS